MWFNVLHCRQLLPSHRRSTGYQQQTLSVNGGFAGQARSFQVSTRQAPNLYFELQLTYVTCVTSFLSLAFFTVNFSNVFIAVIMDENENGLSTRSCKKRRIFASLEIPNVNLFSF